MFLFRFYFLRTCFYVHVYVHIYVVYIYVYVYVYVYVHNTWGKKTPLPGIEPGTCRLTAERSTN